ncbi:hypothetical protein JMK10_08550 [Rhodovulum sulfidophilum]|uniref:hypothetical protein n=1 Tax=Rhodovulum sulfidophilum TaxID=35806 RepID=UPI001922648D|nr:hypothetical protein [Rhodovulum sulfidophilum]MBL3573042.1 hypothetical protein [Rhodovulum sulfidophilum]MCE8430636.1 hypothetical protein [Rhodovulum sulfidophilum]MCF4116857.1 hypothetical protein [Rhodovulum sulfidophilum]
MSELTKIPQEEAATYLQRYTLHQGVPLADAAGFFGTTVATLESVYLHHHPSFQEATAKALDVWK